MSDSRECPCCGREDPSDEIFDGQQLPCWCQCWWSVDAESAYIAGPEPSVHPRPTLTPLPLYGWCAVGSDRLLSRYLVTDDPQQAPPDCLRYIPQAKGKACALRQLYAVSDDSLDVGRRSYWVPVGETGRIASVPEGPLLFLRRSEALQRDGTALRVVVGDVP